MNNFLIGDEVITTWNPTKGISGTIIGFGQLIDVDEKLHPCCIVKLPNVLEWDRPGEPYRTVGVIAMRLDRVERMDKDGR